MFPWMWLMLLLLPAAGEAAACVEHRSLVIVRVVDGDTVALAPLPGLPAPLDTVQLSVRVRGVDTPESGSRAKCPEEARRAAAAKAFTEGFVRTAAPPSVEVCGWDKYGGRVLGDVLSGGGRLSDALIAAGHAARYDGRGAKRDWCAPGASRLQGPDEDGDRLGRRDVGDAAAGDLLDDGGPVGEDTCAEADDVPAEGVRPRL